MNKEIADLLSRIIGEEIMYSEDRKTYFYEFITLNGNKVDKHYIADDVTRQLEDMVDKAYYKK